MITWVQTFPQVAPSMGHELSCQRWFWGGPGPRSPAHGEQLCSLGRVLPSVQQLLHLGKWTVLISWSSFVRARIILSCTSYWEALGAQDE